MQCLVATLEVVVLDRLRFIPKRIHKFLFEARELKAIGESGFFDKAWYLSNNPDVAKANIDPLQHYLLRGGIEGRDPGPNFSTAAYFIIFPEIRDSGVNPLIHYLKKGNRISRALQTFDLSAAQYQCPVCSRKVYEFLPIASHFLENRIKYGNPYTFEDAETINPSQYACPHCGAADRDRLYALYLSAFLDNVPNNQYLEALDIAPAQPLSQFVRKFSNVHYQTADKYMSGVDFIVDMTDMHIFASDSFDFFICSHVLEHVPDDKKALSELMRILKPGGFGILMVPIILKVTQIDEDPTVTDVAERWRRFGQGDHVRAYSKAGFIDRVKNAGFVMHQYGVDYFGHDTFIRCGISLKSVLYIVNK